MSTLKTDVLRDVAETVSINVVDISTDPTLRVDLANAVDPAKGAALVGYEGSTVSDALGFSVKYHLGARGAIGDGIADDYAVIQAAIDEAEAAGGGVIVGQAGSVYRITQGLTIEETNVTLDLGQGAVLADFASGWAVSVGDGTVIKRNCGVRNGYIYTARPEATLSGVLFRKNARYQAQYQNLRIESFKGTGLRFEELNWSMQESVAPLIRFCGVGLEILDNCNAITLAGIGLDDNDTYNCIIRGAVGVTFVGGYNQFAGIAGLFIASDTGGSLQKSTAVSCFGTYFEANTVSQIIAIDGYGLTVKGCMFNNSGLSGTAIRLDNWIGADIEGNSVFNTVNDFVQPDATCRLINVGVQHITTSADAAVAVAGGSLNGVVRAAQKRFGTSLPTLDPLSLGGTILRLGSGTDADRAALWAAVQTASGSFAYRRIAQEPVKQTAQAVTSPYTPTLNSFGTFDITVPNTGLTMAAPTGQYADGDEVIFLLKQNGTGGGAITWNAVFATDLSNTGNTANTYASVSFRWSAGRSRWVQTGKLSWVA